jgi:DNA-binding GntR family transcriptional regulator
MVTAESLQLGPESRRLDSEPLSEQVYRVLRDAICDGAFGDHAHLVQNQLADQLQVSRTPVRDALLRLAQENLVRAVGAKGYIVHALSERDLLDIYEVRLTLEIQGALLALPEFDAAEIRKLEAINDNINDPEYDETDPYELNREFHLAVLEPCPNRLIVKILSDMWGLPVSRRIFRRQIAEHHTATEEHGHAAIMDAIRARDAAALEVALSAHLLEARDEASHFLASSPSTGTDSSMRDPG